MAAMVTGADAGQVTARDHPIPESAISGPLSGLR